MRIARLVAVAALVASAAFAAAPSASASPAPTHVAIVVAEVTGNRTACVPWHAGMTGADVLTDGGYSTYYASSGPYAGLLLQIDGSPATPDVKNNYWSYWQNTGSGWVYAQQGPTSSQPQPGSVEGWTYISTSYSPSNAPRPPDKSYASICAGQDPAAVPSSPLVTSPRASSGGAPANTEPSGASVAATTAGRTNSPTLSARSSADAHHTASATSASPIMSASSASPTSSRSSSPVAVRRTSSSVLPTLGTVAALIVVVALGAGGYLYSRRQRP